MKAQSTYNHRIEKSNNDEIAFCVRKSPSEVFVNEVPEELMKIATHDFYVVKSRVVQPFSS